MFLVDTSIWIDHFRKSSAKLIFLLESDLVVMHEYVILELASGSIPRREQTLKDLLRLPKISRIDTDDLLEFISRNRLYSKGLNAIDLQILAAAIANNLRLLTKDNKLIYYYNILKKLAD